MSSVKTWAIIAVVVLLLLVGLAWYFYSAGASKTKITPLTQDNPGSTSSTNNPAGISDTDVKLLATQLYNELDSDHIFGHDETPYQSLLALSDTDFERVYNSFNTQYQTQAGETLAAYIQSEWGDWDDYQFGALQTSMEERFSKLNLT